MKIPPTARTSRNHAARRRRGMTLLELLAGTLCAGLLLVAVGSALFVALRASDPDSVPSDILRACTSVDELAAELRSATSFDERSSTTLAFTVADRDDDAQPETIRYEWSGEAGDPLTRADNGGSPVSVAADVHAFELGYEIESKDGKDYVCGVNITLQSGPNSASVVFARARVLNGPEVTTP